MGILDFFTGDNSKVAAKIIVPSEMYGSLVSISNYESNSISRARL